MCCNAVKMCPIVSCKRAVICDECNAINYISITLAAFIHINLIFATNEQTIYPQEIARTALFA